MKAVLNQVTGTWCIYEGFGIIEKVCATESYEYLRNQSEIRIECAGIKFYLAENGS